MNTRSYNKIAAGSMFVAVIGYSAMPLLVSLSNSANGPFVFNGGVTLGVGVGQAIFLWFTFRKVLLRPGVMALALKSVFSWSMLLIVIHRFEYGLFAFATRYIDVSVAAIIFEIWPISSLFILQYLFRQDKYYEGITLGMGLLLAVAFVGFVFVAGSQTEEPLNWAGGSFLETWRGLALILLAVAVASFVAYTFRWGEDFRKELPEDLTDEEDVMIRIGCVILASCIGALIAAPLNFAIGFGTGETVSTDLVLLAMAGGVVAYATANTAYRIANTLTSNLGINAMLYATPLAALLWLFIFTTVDIARVDFLIIGAAAIITTNILINPAIEAEVEFGFKALILSLWAGGAIVYLRPQDWVWVDSEGYFGVLGLSATLFTLILSFRISRFIDRTSFEDNTMYSIFHKLDVLALQGAISPEVRDKMLRLDEARSIEETYAAYIDVKQDLQTAHSNVQTPEGHTAIAEIDSSLDSVMHSKQRGNNFGEFFALVIFAVITTSIAILARPEQVGWTGFLLEMFTFPFCAVIVFLTFNAWDVHRDWLAAVFSRNQEHGWYGVLIRTEDSRSFEKWASVIIGSAITVAYAFIIWEKWLG